MSNRRSPRVPSCRVWPARSDRMLTGLRVLVVEDEPIVAADLAEIVREGGAEVVGPCSSVAQARQLARDPRLDAAILDVNLSDGDLTPVLEALIARAVPV